MPFKTPEPNGTRGPATIGKAVKISGQIYSKEDLYVDGDVEGSIELQEHRLTIGPNGKVRSNVKDPYTNKRGFVRKSPKWCGAGRLPVYFSARLPPFIVRLAVG